MTKEGKNLVISACVCVSVEEASNLFEWRSMLKLLFSS